MVLKKDGDTGREGSSSSNSQKELALHATQKLRTPDKQQQQQASYTTIQGGAKILSTHQGASFANSMDFNLSHFTLHEAISNTLELFSNSEFIRVSD